MTVAKGPNALAAEDAAFAIPGPAIDQPDMVHDASGPMIRNTGT